MTTKHPLYDRLCSTLTDYETGDAGVEELYLLLVEIQDEWEWLSDKESEALAGIRQIV